jgi:hypothetical protein
MLVSSYGRMCTFKDDIFNVYNTLKQEISEFFFMKNLKIKTYL